jgi:hypothetical protein
MCGLYSRVYTEDISVGLKSIYCAAGVQGRKTAVKF